MAQALLQSLQSPLTRSMMAETRVRIRCTVLRHQVVSIASWTVPFYTDQLKLLILLSFQFSLQLPLESYNYNGDDPPHFSLSLSSLLTVNVIAERRFGELLLVSAAACLCC